LRAPRRASGRLQGRGRRVDEQGGAAPLGAHQGDAGRRVADAGPAADRGIVRAERSTDAVREDRDRALRALRGLLEGVSSMDVRTSIVWDYAPAPESTEHVRLRDDYGLFIGGAFRAPADGRREPTVNPATQEPIAQI